MDLWKGKRRVRFLYCDSRGVETQRDLLLERVYTDVGAVYLTGYSYLREEDRTFRLDRVIGDFIDYDTGESAPLHQLLGIPEPEPSLADDEISGTQYNPAPRRGSPATASRRRQVKAPSGFVFPSCNSGKESAVTVRDLTDYRDQFLAYLDPEEKRAYGERDFLEELDSGMLEIEVQQFIDVIEVGSFKRLGFALPEEVLSIFRNIILDYDQDPIEIDSALKQQLVSKGFLELVPMSDKARARQVLKGLLKPRLAEEGKRLGLKTSVKKDLLVEALLEQTEPLSFSFAVPSERTFRFLEKAAEAYLADVEKTLAGLPDAYHAAVWEQVEMDDTLPEAARATASSRCIEKQKASPPPTKPSDFRFNTYTRERSDNVQEFVSAPYVKFVSTTDIDEQMQRAIPAAEEREPRRKSSRLLTVGLLVLFVLIGLAFLGR